MIAVHIPVLAIVASALLILAAVGLALCRAASLADAHELGCVTRSIPDAVGPPAARRLASAPGGGPDSG